MNWQLIWGVLPFLLVLACPLLMWRMMRGMAHCESGGRPAKGGGEEPADRRDEEIRVLQARIARLEAPRKVTENWR